MKVIVIILACLFVTGCGQEEAAEPMKAKEFFKDFGECPKCGQTKIDLFGGEKK